MKYAGYMGLAPGQRDDHEQDPRAVKLRGMLVNERAHSIRDLEAFLHALPRDEAARLINAGNRNGKTPFHHACQFRSAPEAVKLLLENSANVNQTTRRGHTGLTPRIHLGMQYAHPNHSAHTTILSSTHLCLRSRSRAHCHHPAHRRGTHQSTRGHWRRRAVDGAGPP